MIAQCWLHIGTEKTGTTSIQTFLAANRDALLSRGWLYPRSAGARKHYSLVAYSIDDDRHDRTRRMLDVGSEASLRAFRERLILSLEAEIAANRASRVIVSNELLATRLRRPSEIARLKALCDRLAQNTKVIVYLRNQADFLASRYTNVIWEGGTGPFDFRARTAIADYRLLLDSWSEAFGKNNLVVRRFEPEDFRGSGLIGNFAEAIGLDIAGLPRPPRSNPSLDAESLAFLRRLNQRLPRALSGRVQPLRGTIVRVLQRRSRGTKFRIARALAEDIENAYRESNDAVSQAYFESRFQPLFSPPVLASDTPPPDRIGPLMTLRVAGFLAAGLSRDAFVWAGRRFRRRFK